jgi:hypothetical protein
MKKAPSIWCGKPEGQLSLEKLRNTEVDRIRFGRRHFESTKG